MGAAITRIFGSIPKDGFAAASPAAGSGKRLLADVHKLAPGVVARAAEIEAGRRVPLDLIAALKSAGFFRMYAPRSHGGLELDLPTGLAITAALGRIDGSVGWTAMIGSGSTLFAPLLPRETYEQVYRDGPDAIVAGSTAPIGKAEAAPGGWRVSGRWPFVSGCQHADWMAGFCIISKHGKPLADAGGRPIVRAVLLPARDWQIEDTWHAAGLKGTGSHDIILSERVVPEANFFDFERQACVPGPLYRTVPHALPLFLCAVAVGIAEAPSTISSALPIPAGSSCGLRSRCWSRRRSNTKSAVPPPI